MMYSIIGWSQKFRLLAVTIAATLIFVGIWQMPKMAVDVLPEFSPPYIEVQTEALGLSATEVEQLITSPLEADLLNGVAWLKTIRSQSIPGLSSVVLIFEPGTNIIHARQMVQERLTQAHALPNVSKPPVMLQPLSSTNRVMQVGLTSKDVSHIDMSVLTQWTIKPRLLGVPGVANVAIWGERQRQLQVQVDPEDLKDKGVTLHEVIKTAGEALWVSPLTFLESSTPGTGGWIDTPNQRLGVRHLLPITKPEQLAQVTVAGTSMPLKDVAQVVEDHQLLIGDTIINQGPGLMLVIEKFPWANTLDVTRGVEKALEALKPGLSGIEVDSTLFRPAAFIEQSINHLQTSLLVSCILVVLAVFAFLYNWRVVLISLVAIAASMIAAAFVLYLRETTINAMVFAGLVLALGVVIDDAIVSIENIARRLARHRGDANGKSAASVMLEAALEMRGPAIYATAIILLSVVPIYFLGGLTGAFLQPFAFSYVLAVLASMVVALVVTPALAMLLMNDVSPDRSVSPLSSGPARAYRAVASPIVGPVPAIVVVVVLAAAGIFTATQLTQSLRPTFKGDAVLVKWTAKPGTSSVAAGRIAARVTGELRALPEVRNASAHVGRAILSDQVADVNSTQIWANMNAGVDHAAAMDKIETLLDGYLGIDADVATYEEEKIETLMGPDDDLVVRIYGHDIGLIRKKADEIKIALAKIEGVSEPQVKDQIEAPTLQIEVDLAKAEAYGVKPGDVRRATATLVSGIAVGNLFEEQKVFDVVVWGKPEMRHSLTGVRNLLIDTPKHGHVQLKDVADVRIAPALSIIQREGVARYIDVVADVNGRDFGDVSAEADRNIKQMTFPLEHHAEVLGTSAERAASLQRVRDFAIASAILIFLILQTAFGSWRLAAVTFVSITVALSGGAIAAYLSDGLLTLGALMGFFAVLAIAARNAVVLLKHMQNLERQGASRNSELVARAIEDRFAPIFVAAVVTALAILPLIFFGNLGGHEIVAPMAIVMLGGIITSTIVTLFVLPALYLWFGAAPESEADADMQKMGVR